MQNFQCFISVTTRLRFILNLHEHANSGIMSQLSGSVLRHNIPPRSLPDIPMVMSELEPEFNSQLYPVLNITMFDLCNTIHMHQCTNGVVVSMFTPWRRHVP
jgi:hypothetical protein